MEFKNLTLQSYDVMGDGVVERMNRFLLSLLKAFTDSKNYWDHLQLLLFFYRMARHSSIRFSPYEGQFGSDLPSIYLPTLQKFVIPDPSAYSNYLQQKLLDLRETTEASITKAGDRQQ